MASPSQPDLALLCAAMPMHQLVLVTGGTGFIGRHLVAALVAAGHKVTVLTRGTSVDLKDARLVKSLDEIADGAGLDAIVNSVGEPIFDGPWPTAKRRRIIQSRLEVSSAVVALCARLAEVLAVWSADGDVPRAQIQSAADRLVARHGQGWLVLRAMVADFLPLMREEGLVMPPDLLLIFKALVTLDGVLTAIAPDFDLSQAVRRSSLRLARARLSPENWAPTLQALARELARAGEDAPRLLRAAMRHLEREPTDPGAAHDRIARAVKGGAGLVAGAVLGGAVLIAAVHAFHG